MSNQDFAAQLLVEGFAHIYVWQDGPDTVYPEHVHRTESAHIILSGEMTMTINGKSRTYKVGERCDLPAGTAHSAKTGPEGCRYLIGER
jgi:mannose-6-phosphate isomerase-like protein (cupin superfamily)